MEDIMKYLIGYYKLPGENYRVYVQETYGYTYVEDFHVEDNSKINDVINELKNKYPDHNLCEFIY